MYPYDHSTGVTDRPAPLPTGPSRWFKRGDSSQGILGSVVTADYLNDLDGNIRNILAAAGVTPSKGAAGDNDLLNAFRTIAASGVAETGDVKLTLRTTASQGWVLMNDGSIGNAASGATARAHADCEALFTLLWQFNALDVPIQNSGGGAATRGVSAAADWTANRRLVLVRSVGRALAVYGSGTGLTARRLGESLGAETHTLSGAEMQHNHAFSKTDQAQGPAGGIFVTNTNETAGVQNITAAPHNNMQPTLFLNAMIKL